MSDLPPNILLDDQEIRDTQTAEKYLAVGLKAEGEGKSSGGY